MSSTPSSPHPSMSCHALLTDIKWIRDLNLALGRAVTLEGLHDAILTETLDRFRARVAFLIEFDNRNGKTHPVLRSFGIETKGLERLRRIPWETALTRNEPVIGPSDPEFSNLHHLLSDIGGDHRWMAIPLLSSERKLGYLVLGTNRHAQLLESVDREVVRLLSVELGRFIQHFRVHRALDDTERRYRRIYENSKDVFYETTKEGRFVDVNQSGVDLFGFSNKSDVLALESIAFLYHDAADRVRFQEAIERDGYVKDYEVKFKTRTGQPLDVLITSNVRRDLEGRILGYEGVIKNITARKSLETKLAESEAKYRLMVENSIDGIAIYGEWRFLYVNRAFLSMFGYEDVEEVKGMDILQIIAPDSQVSFLERIHWDRSMKTGLKLFEGYGLKKDGIVFALEMSVFPTQFAGQDVHQITFRDITEKKEMEEQLIQSERLRAMGKLAFDIAHEINNPLGGIITYSYLVLESQTLDDTDRRNIEKVIKLANRCKIIVKSLLDFARDDNQDREQMDLNEILQETLMLVENHLLLRHVELKIDLEWNLPLVSVARGKMEQVFLNLIMNAAEAMEGSGVLEIRTKLSESGEWVQVIFKDNGPGVEEENLRKLFQPFFTTKKRGRGTGLGLSVSHGIVSQHDGRILVRTKPGEGCEFTIELPCS
ncbi:MAG: PAS domain S-box protein [Deltaproteobacteria bacterium]|nr:PAS domain S-box protein [Deltaproteobacteria bacterium]